MGFLSIISKASHSQETFKHEDAESMVVYYRNGLLTNLLNPKLYTVSGAILTFTEQQHPSVATNAVIIIGNALIALTWFICTSLLLSLPKVQTAYFKKEILINRVLGFILIVVGSEIIFR